ncbi:MAG TPA: DUF3501 family protein [Planctomycetota bacterium]|nr:DUF3501 family protein [Planctomycetota bacterium]
MSKTVRPSEILPLERYEALRPALQQRVLFEKARRRVHVGAHLTFLFENAETVRYQVQEMLRIERRHAPADVEHEVATYNELLGGPGELGCTLLIEVEDPGERDLLLRSWLDLPEHVYVELEGGLRIPGRFDPRQVGEGRLSSVHYVVFPVAGRTPVAVGCSHPALDARTELAADQQNALAEDLRD